MPVTANERVAGITVFSGTGSPNGVVTGARGDRFVDTDTGICYYNTDGAQAWSAPGGALGFIQDAMDVVYMATGIETPSTLPTLTGVRLAAVASTDPTDIEATLVALKALINSSDSWQVLDDYDPAGVLQGLLVGPAAGSAVPNCRMIFYGSATVAPDDGAGVGVAQAVYSHHAAVPNLTDVLYMGLAPDAGAAASYTVFGAGAGEVKDPNTAAPFDSERYSLMLKCGPVQTATVLERVEMVDCDEMIWLQGITEGVAGVGSLWTVLAGACILPARDASGEAADGRVWSVHSTGSTALSAVAHGDANQWPGSNTGNTANLACAFDPQTPASTGDADKVYATTAGSAILRFTGGSRSGQEILIKKESGGAVLGRLRQIVSCTDEVHGRTYLNVDGSAMVAFVVGSTPHQMNDSFAFVNYGELAGIGLPDLTMAQGAGTVPGAVNTVVGVLDAIATEIGAHPSWTVLAGTGALGYILAGPTGGGGNTPNLRVIFAGSAGGGPNAAQVASNHTTAADVIFCGCSPDSGASALVPPDVWNGAANPFDTAEFTGYIRCSPDVTATNINLVRMIDCDERIMMRLINAAGGTLWPVDVGAICAAALSASRDGDGRVYGVCSSGNAAISVTFNSTTAEWPSTGSGEGDLGLLLEPFQPGLVSMVDKLQGTVKTTTVFNDSAAVVAEACFPVLLRRQSDQLLFGQWRQAYMVNDQQDATAIADAVSATVGYAVGSRQAATNDAVGFLSLTNL